MVDALEKLGTWNALHFLHGITINSSMNEDILKHQYAIDTLHIIDFTHCYKTIIYNTNTCYLHWSISYVPSSGIIERFWWQLKHEYKDPTLNTLKIPFQYIFNPNVHFSLSNMHYQFHDVHIVKFLSIKTWYLSMLYMKTPLTK